MTSNYHRVLAVFMAMVVLMSTTSFAVNVHYCGNKLVDWGVFTHAKSCAMKAMESSTSAGCAISKKSCCSDDQITVEGQDELKTTKQELNLDEQLLIVAFAHSYLSVFGEEPVRVINMDGYPPPLPVQDFQILYQQFLI